MSPALAEPLDTVTTNATSSAARAEASRANGRLSRGPTTPAGKERSRQNGCKEGLTGAGIVLPPEAEQEVNRREAEFASDLQPRNAVERELVRQMALGAWRSQVLTLRIIENDARMNTTRFANWEQDEQIAAAELGQRLTENPEVIVAQLQRSSAGCQWMIKRWTLLGNGLSADGGAPYCKWTEADLALALNLLGRPLELSHLDEWSLRLESLRTRANSGYDEAVAALRELIADEVAELEAKRAEVWEGIEKPRLQDWRSGLEIDLGPEGTRLRRYEAAADRLFRSAWTKLERLRKENGEPFMDRSARDPAPEPAPDTFPPPAPPASGPPSPLVGDRAAAFLDIWAAGPPQNLIGRSSHARNKTNPAPGRPANTEQAARPGIAL